MLVRRSIVVQVKRLVRVSKRPLIMLMLVPELQYAVEAGQAVMEEIGAPMVVVAVLAMSAMMTVVGRAIIWTIVAVEVEGTAWVFPACSSVVVLKLLLLEVMRTVEIFVTVERRVEVSVKVKVVCLPPVPEQSNRNFENIAQSLLPSLRRQLGW